MLSTPKGRSYRTRWALTLQFCAERTPLNDRCVPTCPCGQGLRQPDLDVRARQAARHATPASAPPRPPKRPRIGRQCTSISPPLRQLHEWSRPFNHLELVSSPPSTALASHPHRCCRPRPSALRLQVGWPVTHPPTESVGAPRWYRPATANGAGIQAIRFPVLTCWRTSKQQAAVDKPRCGPSQASRPDRQYETVRQAATVRSGVPEQRPLGAADRSHGETRLGLIDTLSKQADDLPEEASPVVPDDPHLPQPATSGAPWQALTCRTGMRRLRADCVPGRKPKPATTCNTHRERWLPRADTQQGSVARHSDPALQRGPGDWHYRPDGLALITRVHRCY